jgi:molybdenum cofactor synthesis domain-containing protein
MDGFALMSADTKSASNSHPVRFTIKGEAGPGTKPSHQVEHGEAFQVATGAYLPGGADAVVPREQAEVRGREIELRSPLERGSHVYGAGEDMRRGQVILSQGEVIRAQDIGLLVAMGFTKVEVRRKPRVSLIATGSELSTAGSPKAGKVRESHSPILLTLLKASGCVPLNMGIVGDNSRELAKLLRRGLAASDFVITLGGTSAGAKDLLVDVVSTLGPECLFHGIKLDRGRVTAVACLRGKPILMLPGPIQAAMNAFFVLGVSVVQTLSGSNGVGLEVACRMAKDWEPRRRFAGFQKVVYVKLTRTQPTTAEPLSAETESLKLLADADGYVVVPEEVSRLAAGSIVRVRLLPGFSYVS